jgi:capsular polysaccharide biosynthesis protein
MPVDLEFFKRHWLWIAFPCLAGLVAGILIAILITPTYTASTVLLPASDSSQMNLFDSLDTQMGGVAGLLGLGGVAEGKTQEYIAELRSRKLTEKFIRGNDLMPVLFADLLEPGTTEWADDVDDPPTMNDAFKLFDEQVRSVELSSQTGLVHLTIRWSDPDLARDWANGLVDLANQELRKQTIELGTKSIRYLNSELEKTNVVEVQQSIYRSIEMQIQNIMLANVRDDYAFRVLDPAFAPDDDDFTPNRLLIVILGLMLGGFFGLFIAAIAERRDESRERE